MAVKRISVGIDDVVYGPWQINRYGPEVLQYTYERVLVYGRAHQKAYVHTRKTDITLALSNESGTISICSPEFNEDSINECKKKMDDTLVSLHGAIFIDVEGKK
jgi:hypothetical protein